MVCTPIYVASAFDPGKAHEIMRIYLSECIRESVTNYEFRANSMKKKHNKKSNDGENVKKYS